MINAVAVYGYRSLRDLVLPLAPLNVITGANGSGKSNIYRALRLMADLAHDRMIASLAYEGGLSSTLWAGPEEIGGAVRRGEFPVQGTRRREPVALKLGFAGSDYGYAVDVGLPIPSASEFSRDPQIKVESLWVGDIPGRANIVAERNGPLVRVRDADGNWAQIHTSLADWDSMMTHCADPRDNAELLLVRESMRGWRFYDNLDTSRNAPARSPHIGTRTPVLSADGGDLAAAVQTVMEMGDGEALAETIDDAFRGATIEVENRAGYFELIMRQHGLLRALATRELSDGTLRYLLLAVALLSPRPPEIMILNEPETSLHSDLIAPLGRLVQRAAERSQIVIVSHDAELVAALNKSSKCQHIHLSKSFGETKAETDLDTPRWKWPAR